MRYAVLADVHGNLPALERVMSVVERENPDAIVVAGDLVGYGPMPNECLAELGRRGAVVVAGNHDLMAVDLLGTERASQAAVQAIRWTRQALTGASRGFLRAMPARAALPELLIAHGSLDNPEEYVRRPEQARDELERMRALAPEARVLVLGHTHFPLVVGEQGGVLADRAPATVSFALERRVFVNPGSVGQSRDRRPRARFAVVDTEGAEAVLYSLRYDIRRTRRELRRHGLPDRGVHSPPYASSMLAVTVVRALPEPLRRVYRAIRRSVVR